MNNPGAEGLFGNILFMVWVAIFLPSLDPAHRFYKRDIPNMTLMMMNLIFSMYLLPTYPVLNERGGLAVI